MKNSSGCARRKLLSRLSAPTSSSGTGNVLPPFGSPLPSHIHELPPVKSSQVKTVLQSLTRQCLPSQQFIGKAGVDASGMNPGNFLGNRVREFRTRVHRHPPTEARETGSNALGPILFWREREVLLPVEVFLCIKPCA